MLSPSLTNFLNAVRLIQAHGWDGSFKSMAGFDLLAQSHKLDTARGLYYAHDAKSLTIFDWILQYRTARLFYPIHAIPFELPHTPFTAAKWAALVKQAQSMSNGFAEGDYILDRIDTWLLECYSLPGICEVQLGDIVLDCGTYSGNTTLYFSEKTGPSGHVYGFEAAKETFTRYCKNIEMHKNCSAIYSAVTKETGTVFFDGTSYGASIKNSGVTTPAIALDDFVRRQNLPSVDFIKMDIEGAEADALLGACDTIRRFKPKMAISAYHKPLDICDLPALISSISPGYTFFLRHYSDREFESVLFCVNNDIVQERDKTKFIADFTYSQITAFIKFFIWIINQIKVNPTYYPADYKKIVAACNDQFLQLNKSLEVIDKSTQLTDKLVRENEILRKNLEILKKNSMP